ncbi:MAG: DUF72 domain-containing protein [Bacteroidales bacterium]|nr:DUF72 domain-containing protein [Bacteroidales bacterium]
MRGFREIPGFHCGTSGWSYRHWSGIFYPEHVKPVQYLEYYLTKFNCVELNSSFYHLPKKSTVSGWMKRTPGDFVFCPKLSRYITHQLRFKNFEEPLARFFEVFDEMKERMGPVLIQLPPGLHFEKSEMRNSLGILSRWSPGYRFAIEIRHKSWITEDFFLLLAQHGMAFVIADSGSRFPYHEIVTSDYAYVRLHGHEKLYASDYSEPDLQRYASKFSDWLMEGREVWVFFNNDFSGYATKNAEYIIQTVHSFLA